jgi:hypothetical protein
MLHDARFITAVVVGNSAGQQPSSTRPRRRDKSDDHGGLMRKATQSNLRQKEAALQLGDSAFRNFRRSNSAANHGQPCWPGTPSEKSCASGLGHLQLRCHAGDTASASATCSFVDVLGGNRRRHRLCLGHLQLIPGDTASASAQCLTGWATRPS